MDLKAALKDAGIVPVMANVELALDEEFMVGLNLGLDYDLITWKSYFDFIKPSIKNFDARFTNYKFKGSGIIVRRDNTAAIVEEIMKARCKGEILAECKRKKLEPFKIKVLEKDKGYTHSIIRGMKVFYKRRQIQVKEDVIQQYDSQLRVVQIEYIWEQIKAIRNNVAKTNAELIAAFDPAKIKRV
jgi:hypothetical protein